MRAAAASWKHEAFGAGRPLAFRATFDRDELARIEAGLIPGSMDDKWFVYFDAPHLFLHRSWTGAPVYRVTLENRLDGAVVTEALWAEAFAAADGADPAYQSTLLDFLIADLLLGRHQPFPRPTGIHEPLRGVYQHHVAGTGHREVAAGTSDVVLRVGTVIDAVTVAALSVQVFLDTYATDGIRPDLAREAFATYSADAFARRLCETDRAFVLAESGTGLLGYAEVLLSLRVAPAGSLSGAELVRLYVQPAMQRRGIGRSLIARAEALALAAERPALWLTAWDGNANARAFYARAGYVDVGATTYSFQGGTYANRVIARPLVDAPMRNAVVGSDDERSGMAR